MTKSMRSIYAKIHRERIFFFERPNVVNRRLGRGKKIPRQYAVTTINGFECYEAFYLRFKLHSGPNKLAILNVNHDSYRHIRELWYPNPIEITLPHVKHDAILPIVANDNTVYMHTTAEAFYSAIHFVTNNQAVLYQMLRQARPKDNTIYRFNLSVIDCSESIHASEKRMLEQKYNWLFIA